MNDLVHALRMLRRNRGFTVAAVAALALGIGANTAIFTVVDAVILRPLPFADADRIVNIGRRGGFTAAIPMFTFWERHNPGFEDLSACLPGSNMNLSGGDHPEVVAAVRASLHYFPLFGARPVLGRTFTEDEDRPGGARVLVMSYGLWQRRFGGDLSIVGKAVRLGGASYSVAGVLAPGFIPYPAADVWLPLAADPNSTDQAHVLEVSARLPRGVTRQQAAAWMVVVGRQYVEAAANPLVGNDGQIDVTYFQEQLTGSIRPRLMILLGAVGLVLLIACANVANLLLARGVARQREIAIRAALGASRARLVRQLLTESLLLSAAGSALGLLLGSWGVRAMLRWSPGDLPRAQEIVVLDPRVAIFAVLLAGVTGLVFGLFPALQVSGGRKQNRTRGLLVAAEVALAVVLLCGAALLIRSFAAMHRASLGFDPRNLLTMQVSLAGPEYAKASAVDRLGREIVDRVERFPGVESAALASALPLEARQDMLFSIPGRQPLKGYRFTGDVQWLIVSPHYFPTLRIPLVAGRFPREREAARTVVISQAMARQFWPNESPVGKTIVIGAGLGPGFDAGATEIIGVAGDVRWRMDGEAAAAMYQTPAQVLDGAMELVNRLQPAAIVIRAARGIAPLSLGPAVRQILISTEGLPVSQIRTMEHVGLDSTARQNFNLALLGLFAAVALILAAVGIYGVMSYSVEQRTKEIGIRAALGANSADTVRLVLRQALRMALAGVAIGLAAAFGLTRLLRAELFGVTPSDPVTFAAAPAVLLGVALAAALVPALRATRVDPLSALRHD